MLGEGVRKVRAMALRPRETRIAAVTKVVKSPLDQVLRGQPADACTVADMPPASRPLIIDVVAG